MNKKPSFILGLTGSIGMGKTTISKMFRDLGIPVWCADTEVNKLYEKNGAATKVFSKELPNVVTEKGIDKKKLRNLIHQDGRILKKIEAIDIGRRSIHDEGAEILREIVKAEIEISIDTSRRLFTLISILSVKI